MNIIADESLDRAGCVESEIVSLPEASEEEALAACLILLGGIAAEHLVFRQASRNAHTDGEQVQNILKQLEPEETAMVALLHRCADTVLEVLKPNKEYLLRLARTLEASREMNREQILAHIDVSFAKLSIPWDTLRHGPRD